MAQQMEFHAAMMAMHVSLASGVASLAGRGLAAMAVLAGTVAGLAYTVHYVMAWGGGEQLRTPWLPWDVYPVSVSVGCVLGALLVLWGTIVAMDAAGLRRGPMRRASRLRRRVLELAALGLAEWLMVGASLAYENHVWLLCFASGIYSTLSIAVAWTEWTRSSKASMIVVMSMRSGSLNHLAIQGLSLWSLLCW